MENQAIQRGRHVVILHLGKRRFIHQAREKRWGETGRALLVGWVLRRDEYGLRIPRLLLAR